MKLRDKQENALGDVRQEEQKADIALIKTSSSTLNEINTVSLNINQEDIKNDTYKPLNDQDINAESDIHDPNFHCHNYISISNAIVDINHFGLYRAQCEHSYSGKRYFKKLLGKVHNI
ncbi:hypothetical protein HMPREF1544_09420 [Mucor circinelloides 1006PhL]|uniref:Uncharacterized protein n=1 Tax=Mucor circinelloides f. circinelloides (strain 1006PhL) TaxID=1220926 RepID=S2J194_MUCC1|nr:hypothetical protein HMPREF1544_09420 [Mucor circinelloides 1006PhL]